MSNKRHPDGRAGLPSAAVVLNKCMTFLFFFPLVYGDLLYFFFFMSPCDESMADTTGWLRS